MLIKAGFLYLADLGPRFGSESGKVRPVVVIQNDFLNAAQHPSTWILPCTTKLTGESLLRVFVPKSSAGNSNDCEVMIDQSRAIDNRRFKEMLQPLPRAILKDIKEKLKLLGDF